MPFQDRAHAGRLLARQPKLAGIHAPIIIALPRGGVPVAREVAEKLDAPLEALVVRKIGAPGEPEYGIGAITEDGYFWIDGLSARAAGATHDAIEEVLHRESEEVHRRIIRYRGERPFPSLQGKTAIVVDDGLATGVTAKVACRYLKSHGASRVLLAVPVGAPETVQAMRDEFEDVICLEEPEAFNSVGQFYEDFAQLTDKEVIALLEAAPANRGHSHLV